jgi:hypothetical protein
VNENDKCIGRGSTRLYAYIYNEEGRSPSIEIKLDTKQIASFLIKTRTAHKITMRNHLDEVELSTRPDSDRFIDYCSDQNFLAELQPVLLLMKHGGLELEEVIVQAWGVSKATLEHVNGEKGMRTWLNNIFKVNL